MLIELGYFPEQINASHSAYEEYKTLYDEALAALIEAIAEEPGVEDIGPGMPEFFFPDAPLVGWKTVW